MANPKCPKCGAAMRLIKPREGQGWLAGILEAEGSFRWLCRTPRYRGYPEVRLRMYDRDIVLRAARMMDGNVTNPPSEPRVNSVGVSGSKAVSVMRMVLPWMGSRRRSQFADMIGRWDGCNPCVCQSDRFLDHWLAGLLEGDGCFYWHDKEGCFGHPRVQLSMVDKEIVYRAASGAPGTRVYVAKPGKRSVQVQFRACWGGQAASDLMQIVVDILGERKGQIVREYIGRWEGREFRRHGEANVNAKLTRGQAMSIRAEYAAGGITYRALARRYGVCKGTIGYAVREETWRDV